MSESNNQMVLFGASCVPAEASKVFTFTPTLNKETQQPDGGYVIALAKQKDARAALEIPKGKENTALFKERVFEAQAALMRQVRGDVAKLDDNHVLRRASVRPQKDGVVRKTIVIDDLTQVRRNSLLGHKLAICAAYGWTLEQFEEHAEEQRAKQSGKTTTTVDVESKTEAPAKATAKK